MQTEAIFGGKIKTNKNKVAKKSDTSSRRFYKKKQKVKYLNFLN